MFNPDVFARQMRLQAESYGKYPWMLEGEERKFFVNNMSLGLLTELGEALREIPWKGWSTKETFNREAYVGELIDAGHFLINLFLVASESLNDLNTAYFMKATRNAERQAEGYDESNKCEHCGRALDEPHAQLQLDYRGSEYVSQDGLPEMVQRAQAAGFATLSQYVTYLERERDNR